MATQIIFYYPHNYPICDLQIIMHTLEFGHFIVCDISIHQYHHSEVTMPTMRSICIFMCEVHEFINMRPQHIIKYINNAANELCYPQTLDFSAHTEFHWYCAGAIDGIFSNGNYYPSATSVVKMGIVLTQRPAL